jgi:hypothetical protein
MTSSIAARLRTLTVAIALSLVALVASDAGARVETPLASDVSTLDEMLTFAARDLVNFAPGIRAENLVQEIGKALRHRLRNHLAHHLVNIEGRPYLDPYWTHYVNEARRGSSVFSRSRHITQCPVCNDVVRELAQGTGISVPGFTIPFAQLTVEHLWYRVNPTNGLIFQIVDPIEGHTSVVPRGQLVLYGSAWWIMTKWTLTGPINDVK